MVCFAVMVCRLINI